MTVRQLTFVGVTAVDEGRLRGALATRQSSRLPWGRQNVFDNARFDEDLKRISAFYADRGYPDARVTAFDVKLNDQQDGVDVTLTIDEGTPIPRERDRLRRLRRPPAGSDRQPQGADAADCRRAARSSARHGHAELAVARAPRTRISLCDRLGFREQRRERARGGAGVHGGARRAGAFRRRRDRRAAERRRAGHQTAARLPSRGAVPPQPGAGFAAPLYGMELFQFVNIEIVDPEQQEPEVRTRVTVAEGTPSARQLRRRLRHRGQGSRRRRVPSREFSRRGTLGRRAGPMVVARPRHPCQLQPAVLLCAALLRRTRRAALAHLHARVRIASQPADARRSRIRPTPARSWAVSFGERVHQQLFVRVGARTTRRSSTT